MKKQILIDGNSIGWAAQHATKLSVGKQPTQAVFGVVKTIAELRRTYPGYEMLVLWDGRAQWRYDIHPDYKGNRDNDPQKVIDKAEYESQKPFIRRALSALGVRQMTVADQEADDMAGYLVTELTKQPDVSIVLITGDRDWIQLVRPGVTWRDIRDDSRIVTMKNLETYTGYSTPYQFLEGKCLQGDSSDTIPGVGGLGEGRAPEFIAKFGSVREFWRQHDSGEFKTKSKVLTKFAAPEGRKAFMRNFRLMQLLRVQKPARDKVNLDKGSFDPQAFKEVCEELNFNSILKTFDGFVRHFKELQ